MRLLVQRVSSASVTIDGKPFSGIGKGLLVLLGIGKDDTESVIPRLVKKLSELRIFEDEQGKMNLSLLDIRGEVLVVSQFTLFADCRRGRRPDFINAAPPRQAEMLYNKFMDELSTTPLKIQTGKFAAYMEVNLVNDGPVTILLDSDLL